MTLSFLFPFDRVKDYKDLLQLHKIEIDLADDESVVKIFQDGKETILDVLEGKLNFKRAQLLSIDEQENRVILSGVFNVRYIQNEFPVTISNGRFDLGITNTVFYAY
jgi:hypothetical protein